MQTWRRQEIFNHVLSQEPLVSRELKEWECIWEFYFHASRLNLLHDSKQDSHIRAIEERLQSFVNQGKLSRRLMSRYCRFEGGVTLYPHPLARLKTNLYFKLTHRNAFIVSERGYAYDFNPFYGTLKALWKGTPGYPKETRYGYDSHFVPQSYFSRRAIAHYHTVRRNTSAASTAA